MESTERVLEILEAVYTDDLKEYMAPLICKLKIRVA